MNPKLDKMDAEITRLKDKISTYTIRLRDLEHQKTEIENADIIAIVRGVDVPPDELLAFIKAFKERSDGRTTDHEPDVYVNNDVNNETALFERGIDIDK